MLAADTVLLFLLFLYLDQVMPREVRTSKPWLGPGIFPRIGPPCFFCILLFFVFFFLGGGVVYFPLTRQHKNIYLFFCRGPNSRQEMGSLPGAPEGLKVGLTRINEPVP